MMGVDFFLDTMSKEKIEIQKFAVSQKKKGKQQISLNRIISATALKKWVSCPMSMYFYLTQARREFKPGMNLELSKFIHSLLDRATRDPSILKDDAGNTRGLRAVYDKVIDNFGPESKKRPMKFTSAFLVMKAMCNFMYDNELYKGQSEVHRYATIDTMRVHGIVDLVLDGNIYDWKFTGRKPVESAIILDTIQIALYSMVFGAKSGNLCYFYPESKDGFGMRIVTKMWDGKEFLFVKKLLYEIKAAILANKFRINPSYIWCGLCEYSQECPKQIFL